MLRTCGLRKSYNESVVFDDVDLEVPDGMFVGLYGPSGIGKSTLAKVLCGVARPDAGSVRLDDHLLCSADTPYDRTHGLAVQMVYQHPYSALDPVQKVSDGLRELARYHGFARGRHAENELLDGLYEQVGLDRGVLNHLPHQISGGEAQRVAIARCLLFSPRVLVLDEATSMLDVSTQANVLGLVRRTVVDVGGSALLISHDRELVDHMCARVYVFDQQRVLLDA